MLYIIHVQDHRNKKKTNKSLTNEDEQGKLEEKYRNKVQK